MDSGRDPEPLEVSQISRHDRQTVNESGRRYQRVLDEVWRAAVHEARPPTEDHTINRQNTVRGPNRIDPSLDRIRLSGSCCRVISPLPAAYPR